MNLPYDTPCTILYVVIDQQTQVVTPYRSECKSQDAQSTLDAIGFSTPNPVVWGLFIPNSQPSMYFGWIERLSIEAWHEQWFTEGYEEYFDEQLQPKV